MPNPADFSGRRSCHRAASIPSVDLKRSAMGVWLPTYYRSAAFWRERHEASPPKTVSVCGGAWGGGGPWGGGGRGGRAGAAGPAGVGLLGQNTQLVVRSRRRQDRPVHRRN